MDKVELTYDRVLAACDPQVMPELTPQTLNLGQIVEYVKNTLPARESEEIDVKCQPDLPNVQCSAYQISFVVESIFAYFLRTKYPDDLIDVVVARNGDMVVLRIACPTPDERQVGADDVLRKAEEQARASISLGESVMRKIIEDNHEGEYRRIRNENGQTIFELKLPAEQ